MNWTMQALRSAASVSTTPTARPLQPLSIYGIAEGQLEIRRYVPARCARCVGPDDGTDRHTQVGSGRPAGASLPGAPDLLAFRPLLVVLGNAAGWACSPAGYDVSTLAHALAGCESILILAGSCSEILYHGVARCASGHRKTALIETVPAAVGAWLSSVRRHAPSTAQVMVEPDDAAFGHGRTSLARA